MEQPPEAVVEENPAQDAAAPPEGVTEQSPEEPGEQFPDIPADLNMEGVKAALAGVLIGIDGVAVPIVDAIARVKCRGPRWAGDDPKPTNGCRGRGFTLTRNPKTPGTAQLKLCGCVITAWRKEHPPAPVLTVAQALQEDARDAVVRARIDRKLGAKAEAEAELATLLEAVGQEIGGLAQDLATASAHASAARARGGEAKEWIENLDQRMAEMAKLKVEAIENERTARADEALAEKRVGELEVEIEKIKGRHGSEERAERIIERNPEAAAAAS